MTPEIRLRTLESELKLARELQRDALRDWRAGRSQHGAIRLAFLTDDAERLADEFEEAMAEAQHAEALRMQEYAS